MESKVSGVGILPTPGRLFLRRVDESSQRTSSGLVMSVESYENEQPTQEFVIVANASWNQRNDFDCYLILQPGATVFVARSKAYACTIDGEEMFFCDVDDVLGVRHVSAQENAQ